MTVEPQFKSHPVLLNVDDLIALSKLVQRGRLRTFRIAAALLVAMVGLTLLIDAAIIPQYFDWGATGLALLASLLLVLLSSAWVRAHLWLFAAKRSPFHAPQSFGLYPTALVVSSPKGKSEVPFSSFSDLKRDDQRMYFFMTPRLAYVVPRRAFDSDADFEAFAAAAEQRWETRHRL
jgi:hypothetical protein